MYQRHQILSCPDHDPSRVFNRWGLLRCELLDRAAFDAALNSLAQEFDPPADPRLMADYLLRDGVAVSRLLHDVGVMASEGEVTHRHNPAWPVGLSGALEMLLLEFRAHDAREDMAYRAASKEEPPGPVLERLLGDHANIRSHLSAVRDLTDGYLPPADACTVWRLLYVICLKVEELVLARMQLEEAELFPDTFGALSQAFDADQGRARIRSAR
ncbi:MAG: hemerythrin domain-containing protein [Pseudomonadota bacterium]